MKPSIAEQIYTPSQAANIRKLYKDESSRDLIMQAIGHTLLTSPNIIENQPLNALCLITGLSPFAIDDNECVTVAVMIYSQFRSADIFPSLERDRSSKFSSKCLVSLAFFPEAMQIRLKRGYPEPSYYRRVAKSYLENDGMNGLSENFRRWENWLPEKIF